MVTGISELLRVRISAQSRVGEDIDDRRNIPQDDKVVLLKRFHIFRRAVAPGQGIGEPDFFESAPIAQIRQKLAAFRGELAAFIRTNGGDSNGRYLLSAGLVLTNFITIERRPRYQLGENEPDMKTARTKCAEINPRSQPALLIDSKTISRQPRVMNGNGELLAEL